MKSLLRIVYMGTPEFAVSPLRALVDSGYDVVGVVTVPDKPAGRGLQVRESAVKQYAVSVGIPVYQPERLRDPLWVEEFMALEADLAVVVAFRMLPEVIWSAPRLGTFNLHASLLPRYRGAAPINWALINGDDKTGVTTFFLDHNIDCGEIISQRELEIATTDNVGILHDKLMTLGSELVLDTVKAIESGDINPYKQPILDDTSRALAPKIFKEDCKIDWSLDCWAIYNKIRGLSPYPAAWCEINGSTAKIFEASVEIELHGKPFGVFENVDNKHIRVSCVDGWIYLKCLQVAGKKPMSAEDYLRGNKL